MKYLFFTLFSIFIVTTQNANALDSSSGGESFYFVDIQKVLDESIIGKAAKTDMESEAKKRQLALDVKRNELEKLKADLDKQRGLLSPAALSEREQSFQKKQRELMHDFEDQRESLDKQNAVEIKKIVAQIDATVKEIAEKKHISMVIERDPRVVLYANSQWDLTQEIIKAINDKKLGM